MEDTPSNTKQRQLLCKYYRYIKIYKANVYIGINLFKYNRNVCILCCIPLHKPIAHQTIKPCLEEHGLFMLCWDLAIHFHDCWRAVRPSELPNVIKAIMLCTCQSVWAWVAFQVLKSSGISDPSQKRKEMYGDKEGRVHGRNMLHTPVLNKQGQVCLINRPR